MSYKPSQGEAALLHSKLICFLSKPFLAARMGNEGAAADHMQLLVDLCHGEQWQAAARVTSAILLYTHDKVTPHSEPASMCMPLLFACKGANGLKQCGK